MDLRGDERRAGKAITQVVTDMAELRQKDRGRAEGRSPIRNLDRLDIRENGCHAGGFRETLSSESRGLNSLALQ